MTTEQKAKAYDEAIERAKRFYDSNTNEGYRRIFEDIFPELAESEDERIKKQIIYAIKELHVCDETKRKCIAWLEKQGEQRPIIVPKFMVGDFIKLKDSDETYEVSKIEIFDTDEIYYHLTNGGCVGENADNFELVEQKPQGKPALEAAKEEKVYNQNCVKPADKVEPKFRIGDIIKDTEDGEVFTIRTITKDKYIYTDDSFDWIKDQDEYELVEQKPADKVEPKFREGEWVVSPNGVYWHIDKISNNRYEVTSNIGESSNWPLDTNIYHSFSIQDAKDSDVLAVEPIEDYQYPFVAICKEHGLDFFNSYCFIAFDGKFYEADTGHLTEKIHPATKEQRDQLEKTMADAGYTFDFEKKELKKIEQKPVERNIWKDTKKELPKADSLILAIDDLGVIRSEYYEGDGYLSKDENIKLSTHHTKWCYQSEAKEIKQPVEWSEEDENTLNSIINYLEEVSGRIALPNLKENYIRQIDWLKSRIPQIDVTDEELAEAKKEAYNEALGKIEYHNGEPTFDDGWSAAIWYLKKRNGRPQNAWKPSDEQMEALWEIYKGGEEQAALASLYNDLKKLK